MRRSSRLLGAVTVALHLLGSSAVNVSVPLSSPSDSRPLARTLVSLSIEADRWPSWTGVDSRNEFTYNVLTTFGNLTGEPPKLRIGGDSEDNTFWSPTVTINEDEFPPANTITPYPGATHITVGNGFYELSRFLPRGTHTTWGINLGADNATNAVNMARAVVSAFHTDSVKASGVILDHLEIGNEVDIYAYTGFRSSNWTVEAYVQDWISIAGPVVEAVGIDRATGPVSVQGAVFVEQLFTPTQIFNLGILDSTPGKAITQYVEPFLSDRDSPGSSIGSPSTITPRYSATEPKSPWRPS